MEVLMPVLSVSVAAIGCAVGVSGWLRNEKSDSAETAENEARIATKLDFISDDVKDIKCDNRRFSKELQEVKVTASTALSKATAANERLDAYGVPNASQARRMHTKE